jgi:hypothetical protein
MPFDALHLARAQFEFTMVVPLHLPGLFHWARELLDGRRATAYPTPQDGGR